jgi:dTDP-4-dehydrorhamnose 3,5-epimerase
VQFHATSIDGVVIIDVDAHVDERGAFARTFCIDEFAEHDLPTAFPQCNLSANTLAGTLRGLHFAAEPHEEAKLVRCVKGAIYDVAVDLRRGSPTRFEHVTVDLSARNRRAIFIPAGFAHGFITLEDDSDVYYHKGSRYEPAAARGLRWNDSILGIDWPLEPAVMSSADANYPDLEPSTFDLTMAGN